MPPHFMARGWPLALSVALAACLSPVQAQTPPTPADHKHSEPAGAPDKPEVTHETWNRANKSVGQFSRGHIDLLRWEQRNTTPLTWTKRCIGHFKASPSGCGERTSARPNKAN